MKKINNIIIVITFLCTGYLYSKNYKFEYATEYTDYILLGIFIFTLILLYINNREFKQ